MLRNILDKIKDVSKKNFTDGLESLFADQDLSIMGLRNDNDKHATDEHLSSDNDPYQGEGSSASPIGSGSNSGAKKKKKTGLDLLIRRTTSDPVHAFPQDPTAKRITFHFEKAQLEKLQEIAKLEKTILKDILNRILGKFIEKYEANNGPLI